MSHTKKNTCQLTVKKLFVFKEISFDKIHIKKKTEGSPASNPQNSLGNENQK